MAAKWYFPFISFVSFVYPPPDDMTVRVLRVLAILSYTAILLTIIKPWRHDDGRDDRHEVYS